MAIEEAPTGLNAVPFDDEPSHTQAASEPTQPGGRTVGIPSAGTRAPLSRPSAGLAGSKGPGAVAATSAKKPGAPAASDAAERTVVMPPLKGDTEDDWTKMIDDLDKG